MAGNEQYHQNAFQAAETGIAQTMVNGVFNPGDLAAKTVSGTVNTSDAYSAQYQTMLGGQGLSPALWGNGMSMTDISSYHFQVSSNGTSARGGTTTNIQGLVFLAKADATKQPAAGAPNSKLE
jgi:hypothetical protein